MLDLGSLEFEDEWRQDDVSFVRQTTYPQFDKYVPASFAKMAQKYIGPKVVYTGKRTAERSESLWHQHVMCPHLTYCVCLKTF